MSREKFSAKILNVRERARMLAGPSQRVFDKRMGGKGEKLSKKEIRKLRRKKLLSQEEFLCAYKDAHEYLKCKKAISVFLAICRRLQEEHQCAFPEVTMRQAMNLTNFPERKILRALRQWKLRGRCVWGESFIPLIDLWCWYKFHSKK